PAPLTLSLHDALPISSIGLHRPDPRVHGLTGRRFDRAKFLLDLAFRVEGAADRENRIDRSDPAKIENEGQLLLRGWPSGIDIRSAVGLEEEASEAVDDLVCGVLI